MEMNLSPISAATARSTSSYSIIVGNGAEKTNTTHLLRTPNERVKCLGVGEDT